jgi:sarcosine/dimethylglycine N-methyltransferase
LELGSGRGGLTRFITKELIKLDKLMLMVGSNISEKENETNRQRAKEEDIPEDLYRVDHVSFDDMPYEHGSFDLIFSNDAFLHSSDKVKCMTRLTEILSPDGALVFTDLLESPTANREELKDVYSRLSLANLGDHVTYHKIFT